MISSAKSASADRASALMVGVGAGRLFRRLVLIDTRMTTFSASSGSAFTSSEGPRNQASRSSSVVRMTGITFGGIGSTTAFRDVVRIVDEMGRDRLSGSISVEQELSRAWCARFGI
jgi:hypothetical protein